MSVTQRNRYLDAQTVSDEHGKGAEVLRQQVTSLFNITGVNTINLHIMYAEVDILIRWMKVMSVEVFDANADLTLNRNRAGTLTALAAAIALDTLTTEVITDVTLTVAINSIRQDDTIYGVLVRDASSADDGDVGIYTGWMPDIFTDSVIRTF